VRSRLRPPPQVSCSLSRPGLPRLERPRHCLLPKGHSDGRRQCPIEEARVRRKVLRAVPEVVPASRLPDDPLVRLPVRTATVVVPLLRPVIASEPLQRLQVTSRRPDARGFRSSRPASALVKVVVHRAVLQPHRFKDVQVEHGHDLDSLLRPRLRLLPGVPSACREHDSTRLLRSPCEKVVSPDQFLLLGCEAREPHGRTTEQTGRE
jgi:hypothetical protein